MNRKAFSVLLVGLALVCGLARADDHGACNEKEKDCRPPRQVCFNVVCRYERGRDEMAGGFRSCDAAAKFIKWVTADGDEIGDRSEHPFNPELEVQCDEEVIFNNSSHRFTDFGGTRIQAQSGPYPAVLLPRGSLRDRNGYVLSALELKEQRLRGYCYVYTGFAQVEF